MLVKVDESLALDMLMNRVNYQTDDEEVYHLYEAMYENYVYEGVFAGGEFDVMVIVDNDYVNWCDVWDKAREICMDIADEEA